MKFFKLEDLMSYLSSYGLERCWDEQKCSTHANKALLINIEPIENMQKERPETDKKIVQDKIKELQDLFGYGTLFANAFQKWMEEFDKPKCTHPVNKVQHRIGSAPIHGALNYESFYQCECGAKVTPKTYGEII